MSRSSSVSRICLLYAAGFGALGIASGANAQSQPAQASQSGATEEQKAQAARETGDIVVTAQRREQSIQSVPASITAFGQAAITSLAISNVNDITRLTPGLVISRASGEGSSTSIAIRGIASLVGTSPTAIYIDDTPIQVRLLGAGQAAGSAYPAVFDLERIEVLKGPQGTLFGASSEGGTVRFITPSPDLNQWGGHARAEVSAVQSGGMGYQFGVAAGGRSSRTDWPSGSAPMPSATAAGSITSHMAGAPARGTSTMPKRRRSAPPCYGVRSRAFPSPPASSGSSNRRERARSSGATCPIPISTASSADISAPIRATTASCFRH